MTFWKWSRTAGSNDVADSTINFREGQGPSTINDSARALMAAAAKFRDDLSGALTTAGSSTAYTLSTYQVLTALTDGLTVSFVAHATSGVNPTLNVDGLGGRNLVLQTGVGVSAGTIVSGSPYRAVYKAATSEWRLFGYFATNTSTPIGALMPFVGATAPNSSFALPYGQELSRTTYASLFALCGTAFGAGDGTSTFNIPDLRGRAIFGLDDMGGAAASRITNAGSGITGTAIGANGGAQSVTISQANLPNVTLPNTLAVASSGAHTHSFGFNFADSTGAGGMPIQGSTVGGSYSGTTGSSGSHTHALTGSVTSGGSGTAVNKMPPALIVPWIIRVI